MIGVLIASFFICAVLAVSLSYAFRTHEERSTSPGCPASSSSANASDTPGLPLPSTTAVPKDEDRMYIGCVASYGTPNDVISYEENLTPEGCRDIAKRKNYQYHGLLGGVCVGSNDLSFASAMLPDEPCTGPGIGKVFRNEFYDPAASPKASTSVPFGYKGCYVDRPDDRALPKLLGTAVRSVEACASLASASGLKYFGLQGHGSECWGGNSLFDATKHGMTLEDDMCRWECKPSDPTRTADNRIQCGAARTNAMYEVL